MIWEEIKICIKVFVVVLLVVDEVVFNVVDNVKIDDDGDCEEIDVKVVFYVVFIFKFVDDINF